MYAIQAPLLYALLYFLLLYLSLLLMLTIWAGCSSYLAVIRAENARQSYSSLSKKHRAATLVQKNLKGWLARIYFIKIRKASVVVILKGCNSAPAACSRLPWLAVLPGRPHGPIILASLACLSLYSPTPPVILR